ncbi:MAG: tRNA preQ1(34) S-adenosylmethionine ribosyltransferase-isomerase QueA [Candidatus Omnitrophica bacterium]|nr:tRNA preQ1(34) S-adenosylmethionine ribosyltransferase-isomerase QueA [Candidatus Omnitrophota bacterium]
MKKTSRYHLANYTYEIPSRQIAQEPLKKRARSRLLVLHPRQDSFSETIFDHIGDFLRKGDVLVLNNTKVLKAKLLGTKSTGARLDVLLMRDCGKGVWETLVKPAKRAKIGDVLVFNEKDDFYAHVEGKTTQGGRLLKFNPKNVYSFLEKYGKVPVPPYIKKEVKDPQSYQTVYARKRGAVAAPTAGFHFTSGLLSQLKKKGVQIIPITLHCGLATFRPVKTEDIRAHPMDWEEYEISPRSARIINNAKKEKRRVIAVGTTSIRTLEAAAVKTEDYYSIKPGRAQTDLYMYPGYRFKMIDGIITNFHTPCSTNLILISTFCGTDFLKKAYHYALNRDFRFFSFGDVMAIF